MRLPARVNGQIFLDFLTHTLPELLENLGLHAQILQNIILMLDGAPCHYSVAVRNHLNASFPHRWIGRLGK